MQYEYPDDYSTNDAMPCREDSDILRLGQENEKVSGEYVRTSRPTIQELEARIGAMEPD